MSYLHHLEHPNILPLLTSYTYNGVPNFLLPLVEGGDLEHLLNEKRRPKDFAEDTNFYRALSGLTSALETLHDYKSGVLGTEMIGYHHDLKPKNVLVSETHFVLSDFGLSKLKTGEDSRTPFKKGQGHYLAPECEDFELNFSKGIISRASDVWSLGCIILEAIVFMVGGADAVAEFRKSRTIKIGFLTTRTFFCGESINPEVERKISELTICEEVAVRKVAALVGQILVVDYRKRLKASEIAVRLRAISLEASYLNLLAAFGRVRWRIDSSDTMTEWNRFHDMAHNLIFEDDTMASYSLEATKMEPLVDHARFERLLDSMERLLKYIARSDFSSKFSTDMLLYLKQINGTISVLHSDISRKQNPNNETTRLNSDSAQVTLSPPGSEYVRSLTCDECILTAATCDAIMSKDEKFLAVRSRGQITIYALPTGEKLQEIKIPDELQRLIRRWSGSARPRFGFSHDGKILVVSWISHVCSYRVGRDESESWVIFGVSDAVTTPCSVELVAISPDSTKVALSGYDATRRSDIRAHLIYVVLLTGGKAAVEGPMETCVGEFDCVYGFSPDGRQLAISAQKTIRRNYQNALPIQILEIVQTRNNQLPLKWFTLYCDEKFDEGPPGSYSFLLQETFPVAKYPRLAFALWDGRWVAALWERSKRALVLHDLRSRDLLASFDLSCIDGFGFSMKNTIFSGNLEIAASYNSPGNKIVEKFKKGKAKTADNLIAFTNVKTNQAICTLKDVLLDHSWLSESGQYVLLRKKKEVRVFQIREPQ